MYSYYKKIIELTKNWYLGFLIFYLPFINFYFHNSFEINSKLLFQLINISLIFFILILLFSLILNLILKNIFYLSEKFLIISLFFYLQFSFNTIDNFLTETIKIKGGTSLEAITIIFLFFIFIFIFLIILKQITFLFLKFFFIISLLFSISIFSYENLIIKNKKLYSVEQNKADYNLEQNNKNINNHNIYFIITDGMIPLEVAKNQLKINIKDYIDFFELNQFKYISKSNSVSTSTRLTLGSLFNLEPIAVDGIYYDRAKILFPGTIDNSNLIKILNKKNYNFYWIGNSWMDCGDYNEKYCLFPDKYKNVLSIFESYDYILDTFLKKTIFPKLNRKLKNIKSEIKEFDRSKFFEYQNINLYTNENTLIRKKDAIGDFENYLNKYGKSDMPSFFFIHHLPPHPPFIFTQQCKIKKYKDNSDIATINSSDNISGYRDNYICVLNKIKNLIKTIKKIDNDSIILIQGDHGWSFIKQEEYYDKKHFKDRLSIFNLITFPKSCEKYFDLKKMKYNINALRFSLMCSFNQKLEFLEHKMYYELSLNKKNYIEKYKIFEYK